MEVEELQRQTAELSSRIISLQATLTSRVSLVHLCSLVGLVVKTSALRTTGLGSVLEEYK